MVESPHKRMPDKYDKTVLAVYSSYITFQVRNKVKNKNHVNMRWMPVSSIVLNCIEVYVTIQKISGYGFCLHSKRDLSLTYSPSGQSATI